MEWHCHPDPDPYPLFAKRQLFARIKPGFRRDFTLFPEFLFSGDLGELSKGLKYPPMFAHSHQITYQILHN